MTKDIFNISGIHCSSCVMLLEELEDDYLAIKNVSVDLIKKQVRIEYDESELDRSQLIRAIEKQGSFKEVQYVS